LLLENGANLEVNDNMPLRLAKDKLQSSEKSAKDKPSDPTTQNQLVAAREVVRLLEEALAQNRQRQPEASLRVSRTEVRILDPTANSETTQAAFTVHGLAVGFRQVEKIEVGGTAATLRKRDDGGVEFVAERIPLAMGSNTVQGVVTAGNGVRQSFQLEITRKPLPLTLKEVEQALHDGISPARVSTLVAKFGVDFALTEDTEKSLRAVGADSDLLLAIAKSKK
jgi:hypothetical protein